MTTAQRTLVAILDDMAGLPRTDPEVAHARADDLLLEAIVYLARGHSRGTLDMADNLVRMWREQRKWYA